MACTDNKKVLEDLSRNSRIGDALHHIRTSVIYWGSMNSIASGHSLS